MLDSIPVLLQDDQGRILSARIQQGVGVAVEGGFGENVRRKNTSLLSVFFFGL